MIQSTKRDQYWSFWYHGGKNHLDQEVFSEEKRVLEVVKAIEVSEAGEVNEAA